MDFLAHHSKLAVANHSQFHRHNKAGHSLWPGHRVLRQQVDFAASLLALSPCLSEIARRSWALQRPNAPIVVSRVVLMNSVQVLG